MSDPYFVPTRSSRVLNRQTHDVVVHVDEKIKSTKPTASKQQPVDELDMKSARFEIYKFAQSGLPNAERQKNQKELALRLGAVPPKRKAENYKVFKASEQLRKAKEKQSADLAHLGYVHRPKRNYKPNSRNPKAKLNKKMDIGTGILKKYGTVKSRK